MKNKILFVLVFLQFLNANSQNNNIKFGTYTSKNGSYLRLHKNGTFEYSKELHLKKLDNPIYKLLETSRGNYSIKQNILYLNTNKKFTDSIIERSIQFTEKVSKSKDSINIVINDNYKNNFINIFISNTGLERKLNVDDVSGLFPISNEKIQVCKSNLSELDSFTVKIFPNFNNHEIRGEFYDIKTVCFESKKFLRKDKSKDIYLDIDFDIFNFYFVDLKDEIVLVEDNQLFFKGEIFYFK